MTLQERIGLTVVKLRKSRKISQEQFAIDAGIDRRYMSDIENGKRNLSLDVLERLANCFALPLSDFLHEAETIDRPLSVDSLKQALCDRDLDDAVVLESPDYVSAVIGVSEDGRVVYSYDKMIRHLVESDGMDPEEAMEFIDYNTIGALPYAGEKSPIIVYDIDN
ncbi:MAG: helix-turn-helix transcriptional regulator [Bacteroidales bacterium]|jgi:transcriptional regulator with XRE-family HTH domain|nr:helix-turn-helix transcriptional regulator [Bacteroidales bacterium]